MSPYPPCCAGAVRGRTSKVEAGGSLSANFDHLVFDNGLPAPPPITQAANVPVDDPVMLTLMALVLIGLAWRRLSSR